MRHPIRSFLAMAAVAGSACDAGAVALNPHGIGEALIYPYYTVNAGQDTLVTVDNTSDIGKAAKVFIREGANGRVVLDFFVFLAPHDSWTGAISSTNADGLARIGTGDHSCLAHWASNPQPFSTANFDGSSAGPPSSWRTPDRTREGMIEIINAGDIVPDSPLALATTPVQDGTANGGTPTCAGIGDDVGLIPYLQPPTDGLIGTAAIVNVAQGTFYPYTAQALSGFSDRVLIDNSAAVWNGLDRANSDDAATGTARAQLVTGNGDPLTLDYARGIDAVSAVFMAEHLYNDYLVNPDIGAATDWVVTFPTREFYVDAQQATDSNPTPFEMRADDFASPVSLHFDPYDREALTLVSRCPPELPECFATLPYQVNVVPVTALSDAASASILSTRLSNQQALPPVGGSGYIDLLLNPGNRHLLAGGETVDGSTAYLHGLPVTGFMVYNVINTNAQPGRLANYGGLFPHRTTMSCDIWGSDFITFCP
jgi:hypothetical protein